MKEPRLRFKEFNDEWKENSLNDLGVIKAGGDVQKSKLKNNGKYPVVANGLSNDGIIGYYDEYKIEYPSITITGRGLIGVAKARNYDYTPVIRLLSFKSNLNIYFTENAINNIHILNESTGVPQLTSVQLGKYQISYPSLREQIKIGEFFNHLNKLIELQSSKLGHLERLRKGYLQKMFTGGDYNVPRLRFKGFNDEWKKILAKKLFKNVSIKSNSDLPVLSVTQDSGLVYRDELDKDIKYNMHNLINYKLVRKDNIVISLRSFQGGYEVSDKKGIVSPAYTVMKIINKDNPYYWKVFFKSFNFIQSLKKVTYGIRDGRSISYKDFSSLKLPYTSLSEQIKIGEFFNYFDKLIELQSSKLEHLEQLKKGYLQKMFI